MRKKLEAGKDLAYLSKELARIWTDAPMTLNLEEVDGSTCDPSELHKLLQNLEFRTLARQLPEIMQVTDETRPPESKDLVTGANTIIASDDDLAELKLTGTSMFIVVLTGGKVSSLSC